jgi:lipoprotein-releasing system permease protein
MRYLNASRENRFFSWISFLSIAGLAIGVAALIVVLSVIDGFEYELRSRFLHANAHIMGYRYPAGLNSPENFIRRIMKQFPEDIRGIAPFNNFESMIKNDSLTQGVLVRGVIPKAREKVQPIGQLIQPPRAMDILQQENDQLVRRKPLDRDPGIIIGSGLLGILNAKVGDTVQLMSPGNNSSALYGNFKIVGTYNSGLKHYDDRLVIMSLKVSQDFWEMGDLVHGLEIGLYRPLESREIRRKLEQNFSLTFKEWQSFNSAIFESMDKERSVIGLIVALVVIVASFNILTTIFVSVSQKQKDISILKSIGATNRQIVKIFISQSFYIGAIGSVIGIVLAFAISKILEKYQFLDLPEPYMLRNLPVHYSPWVYLGIAGSGMLICVLAGLYPALVAARVKPTEGVREIGDALA